MSDLQKKAWEQAGLLLGTITEQLAPKGVSVFMGRNKTPDSIEIRVSVKIDGRTLEMQQSFQLAELAHSINREITHLAGDFSASFLIALR